MSESLPDNPIDFEKLKIGTEPKSKEFSDLSDDAIGLIIDKLKLKERLVLRKVSRGLRVLVDRKKSLVKMIDVKCNTDHISISYNLIYQMVVYADEKCDPSKINELYIYRAPKIIKTKNYLKMALDDLHFVFNDPKIQLDELKVSYWPRSAHRDKMISSHIENFAVGLRSILGSLDRKISTTYLNIFADSCHHIFDILQYLKPRTLERIRFKEDIRSEEESVMAQIANLDQWKQATEISLRYDSWMWPEQHLMNFKEIWVVAYAMELEDVFKWRDFFSKSPNFEYSEMKTEDFLPFDIIDHFGDVISTKDEFWGPVHIFHHPTTTGANQIIEMKVQPRNGYMSFEKIARPSF